MVLTHRMEQLEFRVSAKSGAEEFAEFLRDIVKCCG
jgi:hypothetical protein